MRTLILLLFIVLASCSKPNQKSSVDFTTKFEKSLGTETTTYFETIAYFEQLANVYSEISMVEMGQTDSDYPLHIVIFNSDEEFDFSKINNGSKNVILINNAIHPGEPDGVDASMMLLRDIVMNKEKIKAFENVVLVFIPTYNIGGALNRNSYSRANQNGPNEYGFRGNSRNFDLNRDFIKADTKNARSFAEIFQLVNPDVLIENHVSNGADYQYGITHLFTQHNKLGNELGEFIEKEMCPGIEKSLLKKDIIITPYVNVWGKTPDNGFSQFFDSPRYSSGYSTLFNTLGLMVETHMLKPYKQRVELTYSMLESTIDFTIKNGAKIKELRQNAVAEILQQKTYPISYQLDSTKFSTLQFKGYEGSFIESNVTTGKRLFYDRTKPFSKPVKYYNQFKPTASINIPKAYILKQGWWKIVDRLKDNNIKFTIFSTDTVLEVDEQHIKDYKTRTSVYESHYLHYNTTVTSSTKTLTFNKGDIYIPVQQNGARYIIETLEASATDSFFNWNFFDTILQQKEGYSSYVFEDVAEQLLENNPVLKQAFNTKMKSDKSFKNDSRAQLNYIYKNSPYYEEAHLRLPVYKVFG